MEYRKLISFGKSSYVVSLPKSWIVQSKLKKGDLIYISEEKNNLILSPNELTNSNQEKEATINVDGKELKQIKREIISAYIQNSKTIVLIGNEIKDKAKDIQPIIESMVALEVMEQTSKKIVAKDFLNNEDVSSKSIIRKIDVIIRSMFEDCGNMFIENNYESINYRDKDVNKLAFLIFRMVKYGLENSSFAIKKLGATAPELLNLWLLSSYLESIADEIKRISRNLATLELDKLAKTAYSNIFNNIKETYLEMIKAYYDNNLAAVHKIINTREDMIKKSEDFYWKYKRIEGVGLLTEHTKAAIVHITHIGRTIYQ